MILRLNCRSGQRSAQYQIVPELATFKPPRSKRIGDIGAVDERPTEITRAPGVSKFMFLDAPHFADNRASAMSLRCSSVRDIAEAKIKHASGPPRRPMSGNPMSHMASSVSTLAGRTPSCVVKIRNTTPIPFAGFSIHVIYCNDLCRPSTGTIVSTSSSATQMSNSCIQPGPACTGSQRATTRSTLGWRCRTAYSFVHANRRMPDTCKLIFSSGMMLRVPM